MALPNGRKIVVDGLDYEWIVKEQKYADEWDKTLTIRADKDGGKLIQHRLNRMAITPELVANFIKDDVKEGKL